MNYASLLVLRAYGALKGTLALVGAAAVALFFAFPAPREALVAHLPEVPKAFASEGAVAAGSIVTPQPQPETMLEREKQAIVESIARRYRIAQEVAAGYVSTAYYAGALYSVDPLLILAVMAIESRYNPVAESTVGARGLMQVIPKFHLEKLSQHGGEQALLDPQVNILVGTQILREYYRRLGDLEPALQMYAGALDDASMQYSAKVLAERARLEYLRQRARKPQSA